MFSCAGLLFVGSLRSQTAPRTGHLGRMCLTSWCQYLTLAVNEYTSRACAWSILSCSAFSDRRQPRQVRGTSGSDQFTLNTHNAVTIWLGTGWKMSILGGFSKCLKPDASVLSVKYHLHYAVLIIVAPNDHQRWLWIYYIFWCIYLCGVPLRELRCLYMSNNAELGQLVV